MQRNFSILLQLASTSFKKSMITKSKTNRAIKPKKPWLSPEPKSDNEGIEANPLEEHIVTLIIRGM